jgi:hypothetical protein
MSDVYTIAEKYRRLGYVCVPVNVDVRPDGSKQPRFPEGGYRNRRFDNPADWEGYTGIAVNTGLSGVVAVDVDRKIDDDGNTVKDGRAALTAAGIVLPETPLVAETQSGGEHYLYRAGSIPVGSLVDQPAKGVDTRGEGGVLFVYPTVVGGDPERAYKWRDRVVAVDKLPEFPEDLARRLSIADRPEVSAPEGFTPSDVTPEQRDWALRKIDYKLRDIASAGTGERNRILGQSVPRIVGLVKTIGDDLSVSADKIRAAYDESGGDDPKQVDDWITSAAEHTAAEDPTQWIPADRETSFWDARPELQRIREAAFAGLASPWAVLGAVCVLALADAPPGYRLLTGIGDPRGGNLNLFAVLAAESGGGKGVATQVARHLWRSDVYSVEVASGEALPKLFARKVRDDTSLDGEYVSKRIRTSAIIDAPEFGSVSASGGRTGATLMQRLCSGFSGEGLSFAVSDDSKNVEVPANTYRLGMITGIQYGNADLLLSPDARVTGVPQRFVWFPANVRPEELPEVRPAMPDPLNNPLWAVSADDELQIRVCSEARADMETAQRAKLVGDTTSPLDGHEQYAQIKVAYALALLNGHRASVRPEDWSLAAVVMAVSRSARQRAVNRLAAQARTRAEAAGTRDGIRRATAAEVESAEAVKRAADNLCRWLQSHPYGATSAELKQRLRSDKRELAEDAVQLLVDEGRVADRGDDWYVATAAQG